MMNRQSEWSPALRCQDGQLIMERLLTLVAKGQRCLSQSQRKNRMLFGLNGQQRESDVGLCGASRLKGNEEGNQNGNVAALKLY